MPLIALQKVGTATYNQKDLELLVINDLRSKGYEPKKFTWSNGFPTVDITDQLKSDEKPQFSSLNKNKIGNKGITAAIRAFLKSHGLSYIEAVAKHLERNGFEAKQGSTMLTYCKPFLTHHMKDVEKVGDRYRIKQEEKPEPEKTNGQLKIEDNLGDNELEIMKILEDGKPRHMSNIFSQMMVKFPAISMASVDNSLIALSEREKVISPSRDIWVKNVLSN